MWKKLLVLALCLILIISLNACKKKESQPPVPQAGGQIPSGPVMQGPIVTEEQQMPEPAMMMPRGKSQVVIPDFVKGKWDAVKIVIEDRVAKTEKEYKVKLRNDFTIPGSNIKITVGEFLPDFKMEGLTLTSASNNPNNPALGIKVFEDNKQIFPASGKEWGWLFEKMPAIHPFEHPRYSIILKEGIKKG
ncbi:MAG: hypothetical protein AB1610_02145 [Nitrospirota bacterium]